MTDEECIQKWIFSAGFRRMSSSLGVGIVEGFFGPEWSWQNRHSVCEFLGSHVADFYIYAPKRDSFLRKNWMQKHSLEMWEQLKNLSAKCKIQKVNFGVV